MTTTHDLHVVDTRPLIPPALLHRDLPIDPTALETVLPNLIPSSLTKAAPLDVIFGAVDLTFAAHPKTLPMMALISAGEV